MDLSDLIARLPPAEQEQLLEQVSQYKDALVREKAQKKFMAFVHEMWPGFIHGRHHAIMAKKFEEIAEGKLKRLIINMPPRHTKKYAGHLWTGLPVHGRGMPDPPRLSVAAGTRASIFSAS